jgi:predicted alpha/beta-hydrolase family hydrolase
MSEEREVRIRVGETTGEVSGLLVVPDDARAVLVFGHGAGAGMLHPFMTRTSRDLAEAGVATLRYQFPYMEAGARRVDPQPVAEATVRAAIAFAGDELARLPLFAGGKSYGGRMTSNALAKQHDDAVRGVVFYGFPLHMPKKPAVERAAHLGDVRTPLLFLQGTRDELADLSLIREVVGGLELATLHVVEHGDHSFSVLKRSGRTAQSVHEELRDVVVAWMDGLHP